jgi:gliding motility-associated-like protein
MKRVITIVALLLVATLGVQAQGACVGLKNPTNFSLYSNYKGQVGTKPSQTPNAQTGVTGMSFTGAVLPNTQLATSGASVSCSTGHFRIMSSTEGSDPNTGNMLPYVPTGFTHSIRVGNCLNGAEAEALYYDMTVSPQNAMLYLYFAIVIQAPGHGVADDPTFVVRVSVDTSANNTGTYTCNRIHHDTSCYMVPSTNVSNGVNGWHTIGSSYNTIAYRDWRMACINLYDYLYSHIRIEVMIGDCSQSGHYGYCYFAGDCKPMTMSVDGCNAGSSDTVGIATVPSGMNSYQWYRSKTGVLSNKILANYTLMPGATDSVLALHSNDFVNEVSLDTLFQNTFLCQLTTYMDPTKPLRSEMLATVNNMKPVVAVDSILQCDRTVTLQNISQVVFDNNDQRNQVDTSRTVWNFYNAEQPVGTPVYTTTGGVASYQFANAGPHSATVRTYTYRTDTVCYNEKPVYIRAIEPPTVRIELSDQNICAGDSVYLYDRTPGSTYHRWVISQGGNVIMDTVMRTAVLPKWPYNKTTHITLYSHTNQVSYRDTNNDGVVDAVYCIGQADTDIVVQQYPHISITGETVVCKGSPANAVATALDGNGGTYAGCTFAWYEMLHGTTPVIQGATLEREITGDKKFYVTATSSYGCTTWDSVTLMLVDPTLTTNKKAICTGDTVMLYGSKAATYEWSSNPDDDASFWGQEHKDTIIVSPKHTTSYTVVGKGSNGCGATAISQKITVYDYPIPTVQLTPGYIDSENPRVQFNDVSPNGTNSLWNFGNGETSTTRSIVHTFTHLNEDSILIILNSCNPLGCCNDTQFYIPVGIFSVWYPNAFTPRLETNNTFHAYTNNVLVDYEIFIYNRQGALVFHSVDPHEGWDGFCNGEPCPQGAYVYIATYKRDDGSTRTMSQKGTVTLIR